MRKVQFISFKYVHKQANNIYYGDPSDSNITKKKLYI